MRTDDFALDEIDILTSRSDNRSVDPTPQNTMGMDPRIVRDLVSDHIRSLRNINRTLSASAGLESAISALENEYYKVFGQRLTELLAAPAEVKTAVLELRRRLNNLIKEDRPDLSHRNIDSIMQKVCKEYDCSDTILHDCFVDTFDTTPDDWAKEKYLS